MAGTGILNRLADLHQAGWVFGDLKPQNILVNAYGEAELIDYGGVSLAGRSVKQFTEWYDRGFWNAGSRNADSQYDLFAFALLTIHILESESLKAAASRLPQLRNTAELTVIIRRSRVLRPYAEWLLGAVRGEYSDTRAASPILVTFGFRTCQAIVGQKRESTLAGICFHGIAFAACRSALDCVKVAA